MIYNLHLLRVIAALAVVYFHTTSEAGLKLEWDIGSRGVDIFFVISGFIIATISQQRPQDFLARRLIRVVPFYWAATLVVYLTALALPRYFRTTTTDPSHLLHSLLFIPHENVASGEMMPTLALGWSLNFEMFFYVVMAAALGLSRRLAPVIALAAIGLFVAGVRASGTDNAALIYYARPVVFEFCFGIAAYYLCEHARQHAAGWRHSRLLRTGLLLCVTLSLVALVLLEKNFRDTLPRYLSAGIPAFFIVTGAILLEQIHGLRVKSGLIYWLGESSYIVYLIHPYIVFSVLRVFFKDASLGAPATAALVVGLLALTCVLSCVIHYVFERPVMAGLRRWRDAAVARRPARAPVARPTPDTQVPQVRPSGFAGL